jgi:hypothetical protein
VTACSTVNAIAAFFGGMGFAAWVLIGPDGKLRGRR